MRPLALAVLAILLIGCGAHLGRDARPGDIEEGEASWYGRRHHGHLTASGQRFDMFDLTAAHRALRFGSVVQVENLRNGLTVVVRINDRGPFIHGRIIDLSQAAAERLAMLRAGVVPVRIRLLR